jgi:cobalt-precorrin-6B (C15)-methyltransferase
MKDNLWEYKSTGIPDELFIRGKVPMTKAEVRSITLGKLRLKENTVFVDIGAGTGSVSIEVALLCHKGKVYAIEKNLEAINLIKLNREKFKVNLEVLSGSATEELKKIPMIDRVFVGGTGGELSSILAICQEKLRNNGRIVLNCIAIESLYESLQLLEDFGYKNIEVSLVSIAKSKHVSSYTMFESLNPIYIIAADK